MRQRSRGNRRETEQKSPPKGASTPDNPSVTAAPCQLPLHKGAFPCGGRGDRTGDADCRVASLLAMTVLIIPRRPNGPTWESVLFYDGRGFGPPYERRGERHAEVVGPYGKERKPNQPPKPAGAQRSVRARGCEGWAGIDARTIPKGGPPPRPPRQRLAKRKARKEQLVKFRFCPMTELCSTAYHVRKSHQSPARAPADVTSTEQDRLAPRPAARQGASRP